MDMFKFLVENNVDSDPAPDILGSCRPRYFVITLFLSHLSSCMAVDPSSSWPSSAVVAVAASRAHISPLIVAPAASASSETDVPALPPSIAGGSLPLEKHSDDQVSEICDPHSINPPPHISLQQCSMSTRLHPSLKHSFLAAVGECFVDRVFCPGDILCEEGAVAEEMFFIKSGKVRLSPSSNFKLLSLPHFSSHALVSQSCPATPPPSLPTIPDTPIFSPSSLREDPLLTSHRHSHEPSDTISVPQHPTHHHSRNRSLIDFVSKLVSSSQHDEDASSDLVRPCYSVPSVSSLSRLFWVFLSFTRFCPVGLALANTVCFARSSM